MPSEDVLSLHAISSCQRVPPATRGGTSSNVNETRHGTPPRASTRYGTPPRSGSWWKEKLSYGSHHDSPASSSRNHQPRSGISPPPRHSMVSESAIHRQGTPPRFARSKPTIPQLKISPGSGKETLADAVLRENQEVALRSQATVHDGGTLSLADVLVLNTSSNRSRTPTSRNELVRARNITHDTPPARGRTALQSTPRTHQPNRASSQLPSRSKEMTLSNPSQQYEGCNEASPAISLKSLGRSASTPRRRDSSPVTVAESSQQSNLPGKLSQVQKSVGQQQNRSLSVQARRHQNDEPRGHCNLSPRRDTAPRVSVGSIVSLPEKPSQVQTSAGQCQKRSLSIQGGRRQDDELRGRCSLSPRIDASPRASVRNNASLPGKLSQVQKSAGQRQNVPLSVRAGWQQHDEPRGRRSLSPHRDTTPRAFVRSNVSSTRSRCHSAAPSAKPMLQSSDRRDAELATTGNAKQRVQSCPALARATSRLRKYRVQVGRRREVVRKVLDQLGGWIPCQGTELCDFKWAAPQVVHGEDFIYRRLQQKIMPCKKYFCPGWTYMVNHFCPERCRAVDDKAQLLQILLKKHGRAELLKWMPRSYCLKDVHARRSFLDDFALTAAEIILTLYEAHSELCTFRHLRVILDACHFALQSWLSSSDCCSWSEAEALGSALGKTAEAFRRTASASSDEATAMGSSTLSAAAEDCGSLMRKLRLTYPNCISIPDKDDVSRECGELLAQLQKLDDRQGNITAGCNLWLLKPPDTGCGQGITISSDLSELLHTGLSTDWELVAQKYVERSLCPHGRKMDLRVWLLILRWQPMVAFMVEEPYARLASKALAYTQETWSDPLVHLTNRCQQLDAGHLEGGVSATEDTQEDKHCWTGGTFKQWLGARQENFEDDAWNSIVWPRLTTMVRKVLQAMEPIDDPYPLDLMNSFEFYGMDMMLDEGLRPWLLEVNCSPDLCYNAGANLRAQVHDCLSSGLSTACRFHTEGDSWLPAPEEVAMASCGLSLPHVPGWRLIMGGCRAI